MTGEAIYYDPRLARFYDWHNPWPAAFDYFASLAEGAARVLDLGCGTGIFSAELARRGHRVIGVDPAAAMLDIARARPHGERVRWVEGDARTVDLDTSFDMVLMTGHAFQTLLTRADRAAVIGTIAGHLAPGGRFFFDSRNPAYRAWENWTPARSRTTAPHPDFGPVERWHDAVQDEASGIVTYGTTYKLPDGETLSAKSQIAFPPQAEIADLIAAAGLRVDRWIGDTEGSAYTPTSPEIIPLGAKLA